MHRHRLVQRWCSRGVTYLFLHPFSFPLSFSLSLRSQFTTKFIAERFLRSFPFRELIFLKLIEVLIKNQYPFFFNCTNFSKNSKKNKICSFKNISRILIFYNIDILVHKKKIIIISSQFLSLKFIKFINRKIKHRIERKKKTFVSTPFQKHLPRKTLFQTT